MIRSLVVIAALGLVLCAHSASLDESSKPAKSEELAKVDGADLVKERKSYYDNDYGHNDYDHKPKKKHQEIKFVKYPVYVETFVKSNKKCSCKSDGVVTAGPPGDKGPVGAPGAAGSPGPQGQAGRMGQQGEQGSD